MTLEKDTVVEGGLLEQIVTASSILEQQEPSGKLKRLIGQDYAEEEDNESDSSDDGSEVFEDGDEDEIEMSDDSEEKKNVEFKRDGIPVSVAAVLTELSQATTGNNLAKIDPVVVEKPSMNASVAIGGLLNGEYPKTGFTARNPHMAATINSINAILQSQLSQASQQPQKVRLSGPIRANVNIRHGVWAPRLRCRKRKNLHAKDGIWIHPNCSLEQLIALVKDVLPDEFEWDSQSSPLRYQAVNDQSLQSLKTVSGTVAAGQSLYSAFDLVRNRRSDGDNFVLQLYVYGTWTVLLKPTNTGMHAVSGLDEDAIGNMSGNMSVIQPPPKKKYQQAHFSQQQQQQQQLSQQNQSDDVMGNPSSMFSHMRLNHLTSSSNSSTINAQTSNNSGHINAPTYAYTPHPLTANPPVTFLPTVTLEMKLNGTFVPVEISKRSFMAAIRSCSMPIVKSGKDESVEVNSIPNNTSNPIFNTAHSNTLNNSSNITPPPSDV